MSTCCALAGPGVLRAVAPEFDHRRASAARGVRGHELEAMKSGEYSLDGSYGTDTQLEGADVLMEVLAEDHRASKTVEPQ